MADTDALPVGRFSSWLAEVQGAIREERGADVPCGSCTACCTSAQFVHIAPDETDTLAHIPVELLFPAPGRPKGHVLLGYDERGHCPMLIDGRCSIYDHRPRTCRTYDCRIFSATGLDADEDKPLISRQARRWEFTVATEDDRQQRDAARTAAAFLAEHADLLGLGSANATQRAVLALEVHEAFLGDGAPDTVGVLDEVRRRVSVRSRRA